MHHNISRRELPPMVVVPIFPAASVGQRRAGSRPTRRCPCGSARLAAALLGYPPGTAPQGRNREEWFAMSDAEDQSKAEHSTSQKQSAAQEQVAATTAAYGGPVSDEELAEVYLPAGQQEAFDTNTSSSAESGESGAANGTPPAQGQPDTEGQEPPD